jgi:hypothetical protein
MPQVTSATPTRRRRPKRTPIPTVLGLELVEEVQRVADLPRSWPLELREQHAQHVRDGRRLWWVRDGGRLWLLATNPCVSVQGSPA